MSGQGLRGVRAGLLHTVPALAGTFQADITAAAPGINLVHIADPWLLGTAIEVGVTDEVNRRVAAHIDCLISAGAHAVLVTCSSIGNAVELAAANAPIPVLRVDAPMAAEAVAEALRVGGRSGRIAVLATLSATLGPTGQLIQRAVDASSAEVGVTVTVVEGAVAARESGDQATHDALISAAVLAVAEQVDVVVLAQASMARAVAGLSVTVPILTSPGTGIAALLSALQATTADHPAAGAP